MIQISMIIDKDSNDFADDRTIFDIVHDVFKLSKTDEVIEFRDTINPRYAGVTIRRGLLPNTWLTESDVDNGLMSALGSWSLRFYIEAIWYSCEDQNIKGWQFKCDDYDDNLIYPIYLGQIKFKDEHPL